MYKTQKRRIYPTFKQRLELMHHFGCNRFVYNNFIGINQEHFDRGIKLSHFDMNNLLTEMKMKIEFDFLNRVCAQSLQNALGNLSKAFKALAEGRSQYPKRKDKYGPQSSAYLQRIKIKGKYIRIPKVGWISPMTIERLKVRLKELRLK